MSNIDFNIPAVLTLTTKEVNGVKKRFFHTTASSTVEDAHGDEFTDTAVQKMASQANGSGMSIFLNHEYRIPEDLFGTTTEAVAVKRASADGAELVTDMDLTGFINEANPRARETADALEGGAKLGVSIGARIKDYRPRDEKDPLGGWIINDVELKETSIVGMPANPRSWVHYATKAIGAFERERVKEAADMDKKASDIAELPVDETITEDDSETMALLDGNDPELAQKILTTQNMPGAVVAPEAVDGEEDGQPTFDGDPDSDEDVPEAADAAVTEEPAPDEESPEEAAKSETPADAPSDELSSGAEELKYASIAVATAEILKRDEEIESLKEELEAALATLATATAIVEKIATTPVGRKAVVRKQVDDYRTRITGTYDPEFMKFLEGSNPK